MKHKKKSRKQLRQKRIYKVRVIVLLILSIILIFVFINILNTESLVDDRPERINAYFSQYDAPLAGYGHAFVNASDKCGMDWRLLPAIAMQESSGGKRMMNNNPFGWGSARIPFTSFDDAIMQVGAHLCGSVSTTAKWYSTTSTQEKLYRYNGTVAPSYPAEVQWIMEQI